MADKKLSLDVDITTSKGQKALKDLAKESDGTADSLDDTRTAGQKLADQMRELADQGAAGMADLRSASDTMATALGADFVQAREEAGGSVDLIVQGLRELGLSFDDIRGDADQLADAVRQLDAVRPSVDNLGTSAKAAADGGLTSLHTSADQSRSVLANMVGNTTQDIAGLGGVAGTLGMALGQVGEYATEGGISLSSLAKVAGPMAALTLGTMALSAVMEKLGSHEKKVKEETAALIGVQEKLRDGNYDEAAAKLEEQYRGTIKVLADAGISVDDFILHMKGEKDILPQIDAALGEHVSRQGEVVIATDETGAALLQAQNNLGIYREAWGDSVAQLDLTTESTELLKGALEEQDIAVRKVTTTVDKSSTALAEQNQTLLETKQKLNAAERAVRDLQGEYDKLLGTVDQEQAWLDLQDAIDAQTAAMADATKTDREKRQSTLDTKEALITYLETLDKVPPEKQTDILALIDQGKFAEANAMLDELTKARIVPVQVRLFGAGQAKLSDDDLNTSLRGGFGESATSFSSSALGSTGGGAVNITINAPTGNAPDIERAVVTAIKQYQLRGGRV